jgi:hypothetical protein
MKIIVESARPTNILGSNPTNVAEITISGTTSHSAFSYQEGRVSKVTISGDNDGAFENIP